MKNLEELTQKLIAFREARDWRQFHKPKDFFLMIPSYARKLRKGKPSYAPTSLESFAGHGKASEWQA